MKIKKLTILSSIISAIVFNAAHTAGNNITNSMAIGSTLPLYHNILDIHDMNALLVEKKFFPHFSKFTVHNINMIGNHQYSVTYTHPHLNNGNPIVRNTNNLRPLIINIARGIASMDGMVQNNTLNLEGLMLTSDQLVRIINNMPQNVQSLNIANNNIGDQGATALAHAQHLANLTTLDLSNNNIGVQGATALFNAQHLANLRTLDLRNNNIGVQGATVLANAQHLANLTTLDLSANNIGDQGAAELANSQHLANLRELDLFANDIGVQGATALANSQHLANLRELDLRNNNIGVQGATALANSQQMVNTRVIS